MIARFFLLSAAFAMTAISTVAPADARPRDQEQDDVFRGTKEGRILPLRLIEGRIIPRMRGFDYIGPELIRGEVYRLKFMRGPQVVWIDVDARTGQVIGKSGF
jgi:uncharacterized membrane protein YkoI